MDDLEHLSHIAELLDHWPGLQQECVNDFHLVNERIDGLRKLADLDGHGERLDGSLSILSTEIQSMDVDDEESFIRLTETYSREIEFLIGDGQCETEI